MRGNATESDPSAEEALAMLTPENLEVIQFHGHAESADLSIASAIAFEDAMALPVPDDVADRQDLADSLLAPFHRACDEFLEARRKYGVSSAYPDGNHADWCIEDTAEYGARAFVERDADRDCIRIQRGTLDFLLWAALKHAAANEGDTRPDIRRRHGGRKTGSLLYAYDIPRDPGVRSLAMGMAITAFQFVFLHELGHLAQGHCRFLAEDWSDYRLNAESGDVDERRQSMELMADVFALRELLSLFKARREAFERLPSRPKSCFLNVQSRIYTDASTALSCLSSALACLFYLTSPGGQKHPKREIRFITVMLALKTFADFDVDDSGPNWLRRLCNVVSHVGDAMRDSHAPGSEFRFITAPVWDESNHANVHGEILALIAQFEQLRPALQPHARSEHAFVNFIHQPWPSL